MATLISHPVKRIHAPVRYAQGVGPALEKRFNRLHVHTIWDLLYHFPRQYDDRSRLKSILEASPNEWETITGIIGRTTETRPRGRMVITKTAIYDEKGKAYLIWFNQPFRKNYLKEGQQVIVYGKVERRFGEIQIHNSEVELIGQDESIHTKRIVPIYPATEHLSQVTLRKIIYNALEKYRHQLEDILPESLSNRLGFLPLEDAVFYVHFPLDMELQKKGRYRLVFEEFFLLQILLALRKKERMKIDTLSNLTLNTCKPDDSNILFDICSTSSNISKTLLNCGLSNSLSVSSKLLEEFKNSLLFSLTSAQERVMEELYKDMIRGIPMNRLLQGDVGSGKTVVAAYAVLLAFKSGFQAAIMVPTEILAEQHAIVMKNLLEPLGIEVNLLAGKTKGKEKNQILKELEDGSLAVVVGTHALIQEGVKFSRLGLVVIDEQHKFGVLQRATLQEKGLTPHILVMTATPIPRTLAVTLYGDLDVSVIDELPPGREEVKSYWVGSSISNRVYTFIKKEVKAGRQAFVVCPLIEESEKIKMAAATLEAARLQNEVFPDLSVGLLHGKMKSEEKEKAMQDFRDGKFQVLISTTVIEVGVDCPNATVMLVQNADRFGLAQLHQLRGRIGRGKHQSYCIFMADPSTDEGRTRMRIICQNKSGFDIAEEDLQLRGPGELYGTRQHGLPDLRIANLIRDAKVLELARHEAFRLVEDDPSLKKPENQKLRSVIQGKFQDLKVLT